MCKIIVVANQKGGVAKTSTVRNLSYSLAELGKRVLTVDFDAQFNLTTCFGIENPNELRHTIATLMTSMLNDEEIPVKEEYVRRIGKVDLTDIYNSVLLNDVIKRNKIRDPALLESIVHYLMDNIGNTFSAKTVSDFIKNQGRKLSTETVYTYIKALESAFLLYKVPRFDNSEYVTSIPRYIPLLRFCEAYENVRCKNFHA